ncbi:hypothetical protein Enr13x_46170 [Stieleria neptunia]|uniref:DUF2202 domain-containing protein n=1 Tax=Stieleria neptunia TaxID=2527979 RepID=A0A518HVB1_9BACT|nr:DUF2202 domain-containing protein [Stieleria neptunia]QDV44747.1 hypothetical protein Enr13x_46170 [Stieleria neptunia]
MKRLPIFLAAIAMLTIVLPLTASAQQRKGRAGAGQGTGQGRGSQRAINQSRSGNPGNGSAQPSNRGRQSTPLYDFNDNSIDLLRLWEEEKLARDVYNKLAETSSERVFRNLSRAESQHMQSVARLIGGSGIGLQRSSNTPGVFVTPEYQRLYQTLIAEGSRSPLDALKAGAKIEEMDIADLRKQLAATSVPQTRQVLERLMQGSQNHLRAFASQIASQGSTYTAQFLTQAEFDAIANSSGNGNARQGAGRGGNGRGGNGRGGNGRGGNGRGGGAGNGAGGQGPAAGGRGPGAGGQGRGL